VEVRATPGGELHFVAAPGTGVAGALGVLLAIAATTMHDGSWSRLKICPGEDCGWAFYDGSRNRSGRWCSMSVCGGRAKARSHYHRRTRGM
jgi:predicted RNA-binding Zn ribbon-like protein